MNRHFLQKYLQLILIIIFLVITYGLYFVFETSKERPEISQSLENNISANIILVPAENIQIPFDFNANVTIRNFISLSPRITGPVIYTHKNLKTGQSIAKNQTLFQIDPKDYEIAVRAAHAELKKAKADEYLVKADADIAIKEWKILNPNIAVPDLVAKKPELMRNKAEILRQEANFQQAQLNLSYTKYKLPYDLIVDENNIEVGSLLSMGQSYGKVYQKNAIEISLPIPKSQFINLNIRDYIAKISIDGINWQSAQIDRIIQRVNDQTRMQMMILNTPPTLRDSLQIGMLVRTKLIQKSPINIHKITEDMLQDGKIHIVDSKNIVHFKTVDILSRDNDTVYIASFGEDIRVISGKVIGLSDGSTIQAPSEKQ